MTLKPIERTCLHCLEIVCSVRANCKDKETKNGAKSWLRNRFMASTLSHQQEATNLLLEPGAKQSESDTAKPIRLEAKTPYEDSPNRPNLLNSQQPQFPHKSLCSKCFFGYYCTHPRQHNRILRFWKCQFFKRAEAPLCKAWSAFQTVKSSAKYL